MPLILLLAVAAFVAKSAWLLSAVVVVVTVVATQLIGAWSGRRADRAAATG